MSSRICVKGIRKTTSEKDLRDAMGALGEVTDVRIMRTTAGKSRQFAFVGFRSDAEADAARNYFNGAFLDSAKVVVESARRVGDHTNDKPGVPKSKHSKAPAAVEDTEEGDGKDKKGKKDDKDKDKSNNKDKDKMKQPMSAMDKEKADFLEAAKPRSQAQTWANDTGGASASMEKGKSKDGRKKRGGMDIGSDSEVESRSSGGESDSDSDSDGSDVNDFTNSNTNTKAKVVPASAKDKDKGKCKNKTENNDKEKDKDKKAANSDMDYLRSKVAKFSDDDDSDLDETPSNSNGKDKSKEGDEGSDSNSDEDKDEEDDSNADADADTSDTAETTEKNTEDNKDTGRLFIRNLPYSCQEEELQELFSPYGQLETVHIPLNKEKGGSRGYAFVQYLLPEHAQAAQSAMDGSAFQGRVLHCIYAETARDDSILNLGLTDTHGKPLSEYQAKKEIARRAAAGKTDGWNASFVRSEAVVESIAQRYGIDATDILDTSEAGGELAIRMAVGEAKVIQENRDYFLSHGVNLNALESQDSSVRAAGRSRTTILIKNLPKEADTSDLEPLFNHYGSLNSFLLPPSRTVALVDFVEATEARSAFKGLAYRRYRHTPLYLEWAPMGIIDESYRKKKAAITAAKEKDKDDIKAQIAAVKKDGGKGSSSSTYNAGDNSNTANYTEEEDTATYQTLFLKNLSFAVLDSDLENHLESLDCGRSRGLRAVSLPTKMSGNKTLSMGFGFAEFSTTLLANAAMKRLNGSVLMAHKMEVKPSDKHLSNTSGSSSSSSSKKGGTNTANGKIVKSDDPNNCKLVVRNVAFQATQAEIRTLFGTFGAVKRVRIPKKMQGDHRGFAFVDFSTPQEAAAAMESLTGTHFYGRRLVLEWAKEDTETLGQLRQRANNDTMAISHAAKKQKIDDSDVNNNDYGN